MIQIVSVVGECFIFRCHSFRNTISDLLIKGNWLIFTGSAWSYLRIICLMVDFKEMTSSSHVIWNSKLSWLLLVQMLALNSKSYRIFFVLNVIFDVVVLSIMITIDCFFFFFLFFFERCIHKEVCIIRSLFKYFFGFFLSDNYHWWVMSVINQSKYHSANIQ